MTNTIRRRETGFFMGDNAIFDRQDLSAYEKLVYLYLCRRADSESRAWPSYARIAQDCGISRDTAIRAVAKLVEKELLEKNARKDPNNGNMASNEYILLPVFSPQNPDPRKRDRDCDNNHGSGYEQPGVVADSDQGSGCERPGVVADSDQGSGCERLGVVASSDCNNTHINNTHLTTTTDPKDIPQIRTPDKKSVVVVQKPPVNERAIEICWQAVVEAKGVDLDRRFIAKNLARYADRGGVEYFLEKVEILRQTTVIKTVEGFLTDALAENWKPGQKGNTSGTAEVTRAQADEKKKLLMRAMYS
ncbi:helix-turn-helix domain-containing protein [Desulfotomaculum nigrificans]|uniref:helix-turn-helix domain-containing protein n=1 Tax=Desulfotomaculum nigrificans TaxID=1565 RepID=UPI0001FAE7C5|nr:helix-turn-helix domain-containing protein [Desulfotomaculum nigrificans]